VATLLALIYLGGVFYSRWHFSRGLQQAAEQKAAEQERKTYELYGSGQLKIMLFYASPGVVNRGQGTELCYSVSNATTAKIDHGVGDIRPSVGRCVPIKPTRSTTYTVTATDSQGHQATKSVDVVVE
jgi:hypothetical protein